MQSKEDFLASFSYEKEIERAKWFKENLDKGGWKEVARGPGNVYWIKTFVTIVFGRHAAVGRNVRGSTASKKPG